VPRRPRHIPLAVSLNGRPVGVLTRRASGATEFQYEASWLAWQHALPVSLSMPLSDETYRGALVNAVFENLLPDSKQIRQRVAERVGAEGTDAFSMLSKIGRDCVGALQFMPMDEEPPRGSEIDAEPLSPRAIGTMLSELERVPLGLNAQNDFRISIAGAQEKTALLFHDGRWFRPRGTTPTTHIIKPQIGHVNTGGGLVDLTNSVENEHYCLRLMEAFGMQVASTAIRRFNGATALVVERFDRLWTRDARLLRVPQEDLCQALGLPPTRKYQNEGGPGVAAIAEVLRGSDRPLDDIAAFYKAQILFWLIGATDGHAKNFSIFLKPGGGFEMTPLYDVLTVQPSVDRRELRLNQFKLAMPAGGRPHYRVRDISGRHFVETGRSIGLSLDTIRSLFETIHTSFERAFSSVERAIPPAASFIHESVLSGARERLRRLHA
jgi:serine/threonine-protein kinase HipA